MKNIVLYAPPAAGKGTHCEMLKKEYGYNIISIGEVLRSQRSMDTEIGRIIIKTQDQGVLTPDDIVVRALDIELKKNAGKPIVLDGFPRNINQAKLLDNILNNYIVVNLDISRDIAKKRTLGRVTCSNCQKLYNVMIEGLGPKKEGICDECGATLNIRTDDNENSFNVRFDVYEQNAPDIKEFYKNKNILYIVDSSVKKEEVSQSIREIINEGKVND